MSGGLCSLTATPATMRVRVCVGGRIEIKGNAGDYLGGPLAGEITGMKGGLLIVRGKAGELCRR